MKKILTLLFFLAPLFASSWLVSIQNDNGFLNSTTVLINLSKTNLNLSKNLSITFNGQELEFCYLNNGICSDKHSNLVLVKVPYLINGKNTLILSNKDEKEKINTTLLANNCQEIFKLNNFKYGQLKYLKVKFNNNFTTICDYSVDFNKDQKPDYLFLVRIGYNSYDSNVFKESNEINLDSYYKVIPTEIWRKYYLNTSLIYEIYFYGTYRQDLYAIFNVSKARNKSYVNCKTFADNFKDYTLWWGENYGCSGTGLDYCISTGARVYSYCDIKKRSAWIFTKGTHDNEGWPLYYFAKENEKNYLPLKIYYSTYRLIFNISSNISCYELKNKDYYKIDCENLLSYKNVTIIDKNNDLKMEIYGIKEPTEGKTVTITLKKLNESIGKVKIKASIENLSFEKAIVYVPITLDENRQVIKTTKNGKPYLVPKYYLVYEFNETDPIFESEIGSLLTTKTFKFCLNNVCKNLTEGDYSNYYLNFSQGVFKYLLNNSYFEFYFKNTSSLNLSIESQENSTTYYFKTNSEERDYLAFYQKANTSLNYFFTLDGNEVIPYTFNDYYKLGFYFDKTNRDHTLNIKTNKKVSLLVIDENKTINSTQVPYISVFQENNCFYISNLNYKDVQLKVCGTNPEINKIKFYPVKLTYTEKSIEASILDAKNVSLAVLMVKINKPVKEVLKNNSKIPYFSAGVSLPYYKVENGYIYIYYKPSDPIISILFTQTAISQKLNTNLVNYALLLTFLAFMLLLNLFRL